MAELIPPQINNGGTGAPNVGNVRAPDYRQLQAPVEVDVRHIDAAADDMARESSARAEELSRAFGAGNDVLQTGLRIAGNSAGQKAVAGGNPQPVSGLAALTSYGQGYNNAVHMTYEVNSKVALEGQLAQIESQTQSDPVSYAKQANAAVQAALKQTPEPFRTEMTPWATARVQAGVLRQQQQKADDVRNQALATYQQSTPDLITGALHTAAALPGPQGDAVISKLISDDKDRLNALVASHVITPEQAVTMHQKMVADAQNQMSGQKVTNSLTPIESAMRANVETADQMILQNDPALTPAQNAARLHTYLQDREQYVKAQTAAHASDLAAVHAQLAGGGDDSYGPELEGRLRSLYQAGAFTEEGYFSALSQSVRNQRSNIDDTADMQLVDQIVHGERQGPLDPKDGAQAAAVDKYFQAHVTLSGANISPDQYAAGAAEVFRQTGILPASVQARIRIGLMSGDPQRAAQAAALAAKVQSVNPTADAFVQNPKLAALSGLINDNLKAGLPPTQAYSLAVGATEVTGEQRKIRDQNYTKALQANGPNSVALQTALNKATPGIFSHAPPAPVAMQAQYDTLVREYYAQTGDIAKARSIAATQLRQTWGLTKVNGSPELMKYPIPDGQVPTVRADIASSAKAAGYAGDPAQIHLVPNAATDASGGRIFALVHTDPATGLSDVLLDKNNRPLQYQLPSTQNFAQARQQLIEQKLAAARKERAQQRQDSANASQFETELSNHYLSGQLHFGAGMQ